jgi:hypothetical protein
MKDINLFEILAQIGALIGTENSQGEANHGPQVHHGVSASIMLAQFMDLGVAVVTPGNTVVGAGVLDLLVFKPSVFKALFLETGLQEPASAAAAIVVGAVGLHIDKIVLPHDRLDDIAQVLGDRVPVTFPNDLTRILYREFNFPVGVPFRTDLKFAFTYPFGVVLVDVFHLKAVFQIELFQPGPD